MGNNVRVRTVWTVGLAAVLAVALAAVGIDFGTSIYAEYRLSRSVRTAAHLESDPNVAILGFPFIAQARADRYGELEIKAVDVAHPRVGRAALEATMHDIDLLDRSWLIEPDATLHVGTLESRIIIDSRHLGQFMGIRDLMVEAPPADTNDATGGTTESGISRSEGLVFTGTPTAADFHRPVSVSVDLTMAGPDRSTLVITPTGILTGPDTADQHVPEDRQTAVFAAFAARLPDQRLPFTVAPTSWGARGSEVIIEGIVDDVTVTLPQFRPPGPRP
ncbi:mannan chain length control protein LmeA [Mycobacterium koreense]|uniref:Uncharacterized protein n=1 Tax=Mycolicibacillus koreensis TaxID=1069220 RepID=A0A7I7SHR5_9MYCO|nr:mannan chain length control protein LmeA [Mycolicibacillus koreensis]MCV7247306.1 mannan chain length control protein LmeA [Mycolicibacillus koreensis]OSC34181.1 hypothetical protein B8W67_07485 [Mycolicibacillus koreensis]BBY56497.1 hypothetical protein MKOR_37480 [Mycolicibacillus koreensis]